MMLLLLPNKYSVSLNVRLITLAFNNNTWKLSAPLRVLEKQTNTKKLNKSQLFIHLTSAIFTSVLVFLESSNFNLKN
ncbi:hypothetical protein QVD17_32303 [Tagetes erecta]|uniref:Uncharacterized protein n=1 Tax=Tagetes erecta TaxID=13708 RepID=A0AAD8K5D7_TARER|nr:hypothetical protein QVD17_32303 [Tagetes erecta]